MAMQTETPALLEAERLKNEVKRAIDGVLPEVSASLDALSDSATRAESGTFRTLGALYVILARCRREPAFLEALMETHKVRPWGQREASHFVVQAVKNATGNKAEWPRSTASDWAKMLRACEVAKVEADASMVVGWFEQEQDVLEDGKPLRGYRKARAVLAIDPEECESKERQREDRRRLLDDTCDREISKGSEALIGSIVPGTDQGIPEGVWVAIMDGSDVRRPLTTDMKLIRKIALLCQETTSESQAAHP